MEGSGGRRTCGKQAAVCNRKRGGLLSGESRCGAWLGRRIEDRNMVSFTLVLHSDRTVERNKM